jgi:hypothetical protein
MQTKPKPILTTGIRLPQDMRDYLEKQAEANSRSLSQEINHRLKQSRAEDEQRQGAAQ